MTTEQRIEAYRKAIHDWIWKETVHPGIYLRPDPADYGLTEWVANQVEKQERSKPKKGPF